MKPGSNGPNHEWGVDEGPDPLGYSLSIPLKGLSGTAWNYCNANSYLLGVTLSAALERAGREDIFQFAKKFLMEPLEISNYRLTHSMKGKFINGQGNAYFTPKDLMKFGQLILAKGKWKDRQIISAETIAAIYNPKWSINWSFLDSDEVSPTKYAFQWYTTFMEVEQFKIKCIHSWGNGGQYIFVLPELEAVVVFTGSNQGNFAKQKQPFEIMKKFILPKLHANYHNQSQSE